MVLGWLVTHLNDRNVRVSHLWLVLDVLELLCLIRSLRIVNEDLET